MKTIMVLIAGAMFASLTIGAANGPSAVEQYKAKYGTYPPYHKVQATAEVAAAECCAVADKRASVASDQTEERNRMKYGRYSPAKEQEVTAKREELALHDQKCVVLAQCPMPREKSPAAALSANDARQLTKYGRILRVEESNVPVEVAVLQHAEPCEHACCQHGE